MGEFVGIDPRGAHELIRRMEAGKAFLGRTRPSLDAAIAEAGPDWAGHQGSTAVRRAWAFFHESQQDLRWRVDTAEQLVPVRERGLLTADFPFGSESEARQDAEDTAAAVRAALDDPRALARALSAAVGKAGDPAYAAALLAALGPETFTGALRLLTGAPLGEADAALLARAFAGAERTGRLGDEWHALAETAPAEVLTALVSLAGPSGTFLGRVALALLDRPGPVEDLGGLVAAFAANPVAFQEFLAGHPGQAATLLTAAAGDPGLDAALRA
ncbi:hypothetical protein ACWEPC_45985, partial [Nonomuraea sp. NPDC004297]